MFNHFSLGAELARLRPAAERAAQAASAAAKARMDSSKRVSENNLRRYAAEHKRRLDATLHFIAANQPVQRPEIAEAVGVSPTTLTHILRELRDQKLIRTIGTNRSTQWVTVDKPHGRAQGNATIKGGCHA